MGAWFPLVLLALLAALSFWLDRIVQPQQVSSDRGVRHNADYIVEGLAGVSMDARGAVKHTLNAQKMTHYPDDDTTHLVAPTFVTYSEGHAPVTVTSREATISPNGEDIYFVDDVRVVRTGGSTQGDLIVETDYLHVIPDDNVAKTNRPVTIRNASAVVTASGLELNSETRVLELQGRVRGVYTERGTHAR